MMEINNLRSLRYSITDLRNGSTLFSIQGSQARFTESMAATYSQLIKNHTARLLQEGKPDSIQQVIRNHMTALRALLRSLNKSETSPIGPEFTTDFAQCIKEHLATAGLSDRSKADRRSLLTAWRTSFEQMKEAPESLVRGRERRSADTVPFKQTPFERGLKAALKAAKLAPKAAATLAGVSTSALGRWSRGALPNERSTPCLEKLDCVLGLSLGTLADLLRETNALRVPTHGNAFRERIKSTPNLNYSLKVKDVPDELLSEWRALFDHKTAVFPKGLRRQAGGRWSLADVRLASCVSSPVNSKGNQVAASADIMWGRVSTFLGFLRLPAVLGGYGLPPADVNTLAWLAVPEAVEAYLEFLTERSDGLKHGGHKVFCSQVAGLNNPTHGYLVQCPELAGRLPANIASGRPWAALCDETFEIVKVWKVDSDDTSRAPEAPLQFFLAQEFPLEPVFDAMRQLRENAAKAAGGSVAEALARRDELLLGLLVSNPLRAKNIKTLTYKSDNSGNIYQSHVGDWRIRIPGRQFKNRKRVGKMVYDVPVARWLCKLLNDYVRCFRVTLVAGANGGDTGFFFVSSRGGKRFDSMNKHIYALTKALIPQCGGISPHAFRHLVATDWLTTHPNDFLTIAELLNDTLAVVLKDYAHLKKDVAFSRYEAHVERFAPRD